MELPIQFKWADISGTSNVVIKAGNVISLGPGFSSGNSNLQVRIAEDCE